MLPGCLAMKARGDVCRYFESVKMLVRSSVNMVKLRIVINSSRPLDHQLFHNTENIKEGAPSTNLDCSTCLLDLKDQRLRPSRKLFHR